jgi:hypothetical protein
MDVSGNSHMANRRDDKLPRRKVGNTGREGGPFLITMNASVPAAGGLSALPPGKGFLAEEAGYQG